MTTPPSDGIDPRKVSPSATAPTRAYITDDAVDVVEFGEGQPVQIVDDAREADLRIRVAGMSASDALRVARQYGVRVTPEGAES